LNGVFFLHRRELQATVHIDLVTIQVQGSTLTAVVDSLSADLQSIEKGDFLSINPVASLTDNINNVQNNPDNRKVAITLMSIIPPFTVESVVSGNPLTAGIAPPAAVVRAYQQANESIAQSGVLVITQPADRSLFSSKNTLHARITVMDIVNNIVVDNVPMVWDQSGSKRLYFMWDGKNTDGRHVATGTYVAVVTVEDQNGKQQVNRVRIGVKR